MKLGDTVKINKILVRCAEMRKRKRFDGREETRRYKLWREEKTPERKGVFLGFRSLSDGFTSMDYDAGWLYAHDKVVRAALVVFTATENPVYVPRSEIEN